MCNDNTSLIVLSTKLRKPIDTNAKLVSVVTRRSWLRGKSIESVTRLWAAMKKITGTN